MKYTTKEIVERIKEVKADVPSDWAEKIAERMGKEPVTIRAYARGERGIKKGQHIKLLQHLIELQSLHRQFLKNLTANN